MCREEAIMARITVEEKVLAEGRLHTLADYLGVSSHTAIGLLVYLWHDSQELRCAVATSSELESWCRWREFKLCYQDIMQVPDLRAGLELAGYISKISENKYKIHGNEKHIDSLERYYDGVVNGGKIRASKAKRGKDGRYKTKPASRPARAGKHPPAQAGPASSAIQYNSIQNNTEKNIYSSKFNFDLIYDLYPKKVGKKKGLEKCRSQIKTQEQYDNLHKSVERYKKHCIDEKTESQFIKHFSTFMNSWEDWIEESVGSTDLPKEEDFEVYYERKQREKHDIARI